MKFEKYLQEILSDQKSAIDAAKMWDKVSDNIDFKPKKKRGIIFWFSGIGILLLFVIGLFTFIDLMKKENTSLATEVSSQKSDPSKTSTQPISLNNNLKTSSDTNEKTHTDSSEPSLFNEKTTISSPIKNKPSQEKSKTVEPNIYKSLNPIKQNIDLPTSKKSVVQSEIYNPLPAKHSMNKIIATSTTTISNKEIALNKDMAILNSSSKTSGKSNEVISAIPVLAVSTLDYQKVKITLLDKPLIQETFLPDPHRNLSIDFISAAGIGKKSLSSDTPLYADLRNKTETTLEHFNIAAELNYHINAQWSIGTGIDMLSHTEKFEWEGDYVESVNGTYVDTIFYATKTDFTTSNATGEYQATTHRNMRMYNQYRFINIPIAVRYQFKVKEHHFSIQPRVLFNISYNAYGDYLNPTGVPSLLEDLKTDAKLQYQLGLNYHRSIGQLWDFNIGSAMRWAPKTTLGENAVKTVTDYRFFNLRLGISRKF